MKWRTIGIERNERRTPEQRLLAAILYRAYEDLTRPINLAKCHKEAALDWFFDDESKEEFSFLWLCEHLDLNPAAIRRDLEEKMVGDIMITYVTTIKRIEVEQE